MRASLDGSLIHASLGGVGAVGGLVKRVGLAVKAVVRVRFRAVMTVLVWPWWTV